ncbi:hypothetical protein BWI17_01875 [Betaproteobacteria bacterium GR16-43]|nr:hypothetical protein BWI17_01875 [Betaproteobacteria bacterium GR16-43]
MTHDSKASPSMKATLAALGASLGVAMVTVAYAGDGSVKPPDAAKDPKNAPADAKTVKLAPADAKTVKLAPADAAAVKLKPPPEEVKVPGDATQMKNEALKNKPAGK